MILQQFQFITLEYKKEIKFYQYFFPLLIFFEIFLDRNINRLNTLHKLVYCLTYGAVRSLKRYAKNDCDGISTLATFDQSSKNEPRERGSER